MALDGSRSFHTYREYVADLQKDYPEYSWLGEFLAASGATPSQTRVSIIDIVDGVVRGLDYSGNVPALTDVLRHRPASAWMRIVHVKYRQSWSIDRAVVDVVGRHFVIDPAFFWGHFAHHRSNDDKLCPSSVRSKHSLRPEPLPSDMFSLEVAIASSAFSALLIREGVDNDMPANTAIIFFRDGEYQPSSSLAWYSEGLVRPVDFEELPQHLRWLPSTWSEALLLKMRPEAVKSAHGFPSRFIYPFARLFALEMNILVQGAFNTNLVKELDSNFELVTNTPIDTDRIRSVLRRKGRRAVLTIAKRLQTALTVLHEMEANIQSTLNSISRFPALGSPERAALLTDDFRDVLARAKKAQEDLREYLKRQIGLISLLESRLGDSAAERSVLQAKSVNRLTKLAFVFIPLSFLTSFSGMNFKEFGEGTLSLWVFAVAAAVLALALLLSPRLHRLQTNPGRPRARERCGSIEKSSRSSGVVFFDFSSYTYSAVKPCRTSRRICHL